MTFRSATSHGRLLTFAVTVPVTFFDGRIVRPVNAAKPREHVVDRRVLPADRDARFLRLQPALCASAAVRTWRGSASRLRRTSSPLHERGLRRRLLRWLLRGCCVFGRDARLARWHPRPATARTSRRCRRR